MAEPSTITLTRQALHDQVWTTPMTKLAAQYGLSDRGLAKLCARHKIPVPSRGFWRRKETGQPVIPRPLPPAAQIHERIEITPPPAIDLPEHHDVVAQIAYEAAHPISVPDQLHRPHPLVARTRDYLASRKADEYGMIRTRGDCFRLRISKQQAPRGMRFLDTLLKACEERGFSVTSQEYFGKPATKIIVHDEPLDVELEERTHRADHVLTSAERAQRAAGRDWSINRYDYNPTGTLLFTIHEEADGMRHRWADGNRHRLEDHINEIIITLVTLSLTILKPRRLKWEEEQRRREEQERRWEAERKRRTAINESLVAWQRSEELRRFIKAIEEEATRRFGTIPEDSPTRRWLRWAEGLANQIDPIGNLLAKIETNDPTTTSTAIAPTPCDVELVREV